MVKCLTSHIHFFYVSVFHISSTKKKKSVHGRSSSLLQNDKKISTQYSNPLFNIKNKQKPL